MRIDTALAFLFPDINFLTECEIRDDGNGQYIANWWRPEPQPTAEDIEAARIPGEQAYLVRAYTDALTAHLDAVAQQRRYDNRINCMVRAGFPGPYKAEAVAFATWADNCNALGYQVMADVMARKRALPTIPQMLAELPPMVWPA